MRQNELGRRLRLSLNIALVLIVTWLTRNNPATVPYCWYRRTLLRERTSGVERAMSTERIEPEKTHRASARRESATRPRRPGHSTATQQENTMIIKSVLGATRIVVAASALVIGMGMAHAETFNPSKFFERLQAEGNSAPKDFDAKKFFDKLQAEGNSDTKKIDAKTFFDKLQAEGNSMPKDFDAKKFFDKLQAEGNSNVMPPMVAMPK
jgi:hypothetical protein